MQTSTGKTDGCEPHGCGGDYWKPAELGSGRVYVRHASDCPQRGPTPGVPEGFVSLVAVCRRCGESFNPHSQSPDDLIHGQRADGADCLGMGDLRGGYR